MRKNYTEPSGQADIVAHIIASGFPIRTILDVGIGNGFALRAFHAAGMEVTGTGFHLEAYLSNEDVVPEGVRLVPDLDVCSMHIFQDGAFDAVWCSHVLEHLPNVQLGLDELRRVLKPGGYLFVVVPPFKHEIVGGHLSTGWNVGMLMYRLAFSGFELHTASFVRHGYNVAGIVQRGRGSEDVSTKLRMASGDLEVLGAAGHFPAGFRATQGFNGDLANVNWHWACVPKQPLYVPSPNRPALKNDSVTPTSLQVQSRLRIGMFIPWITQGRGGTERIGTIVANALAQRGHQIFIHTFDDDRRPPSWELDPTIKLRCHSDNYSPTATQQVMMEISAQRLDVLVGLHMNREFFRYIYYSKAASVPVVLSEHIDPTFPRALGRFGKDERDAIFTAADHIHVILEEFVQTLPRHVQQKTTVIPNCVPDVQKLADVRGNDVAHRTLLTVARLVPRKNIGTLIRAFHLAAQEVPGWRLKVAGYGPQKDELSRLADELGIGARVDFLGEVERPYELYCEAQLFALPSTTEAFGLTALEAMAHGLPVVAFSDCPGLNMLVRDGLTGLLASRSQEVSSLAGALKTLMADSEARARYGQASRERFQQFSIDRVAKLWEELLFRVAASRTNISNVGSMMSKETRLLCAVLERCEADLESYFSHPLFAQ